MIDFVIRSCGNDEWLPIIVVTSTGKELYRGDRTTLVGAVAKAKRVWDGNQTGNIIDFKKERGIG